MQSIPTILSFWYPTALAQYYHASLAYLYIHRQLPRLPFLDMESVVNSGAVAVGVGVGAYGAGLGIAGLAGAGLAYWASSVAWGILFPPTTGPVTMATIKEVPKVSANLIAICHTHFELFNTYPTQGADTFFQVLDIDPDSAPFNTPAYLRPGEEGHDEARDIITVKWTERQKRLKDHSRYDDQTVLPNKLQLLYRVAAALQDDGSAGTYMGVVLPALTHKSPDQRITALKDLCGDN